MMSKMDRMKMDKAHKSMKPGGGGRFKKLKGKLARKGVDDPDALAAHIGRKKYGNDRFEEMSEKGRKRSAVRKSLAV